MMSCVKPQAMEARGRHSQNDGAWDHHSPTSFAMIKMIRLGNPRPQKYAWLYLR
jgi:hypothetical protein